MKYLLTVIIMLTALVPPAAAQDTGALPAPAVRNDSVRVITIRNADIMLVLQGKDSSDIIKLIGNVVLEQGTTTFTCDSAFKDNVTNILDAYGHIHIKQSDSVDTYGDYLHYIGNEKKASLQKNVSLTDGVMVLTTSRLDYDLNARLGIYYDGGKLVNGNTVLTSRRGYYYADTKDAYFSREVVLVDPQYTLHTDSLAYNALTHTSTFVAPTIIRNERSVIHTSNGYYNTDSSQAMFADRSTIVDSSQTVTADSMFYFKSTGMGIAKGNVVWTDTARKVAVLSGYAETNERSGTLLATQKPLFVNQVEKDTLYMTADTLFSGIIQPDSGRIQPDSNRAVYPDSTAGSSDSSRFARQDSTVTVDSLALPSLQKADTAHPLAPSPEGEKLAGDTLVIKLAGDTSVKKPVRDTSVKKLEEDTLVKKLAGDTMVKKPVRDTSVKRLEEDTLAKKLVGDASVKKLVEDTSVKKDTAEQRYFIAYHHVRIFSDSLQGVADSMYYSFTDSTIRLFSNPLLWIGDNQLGGDTIYLHTKDQKADKLDLLRNAIVVNIAGPGLYNQVEGTNIYGFFKDNKLDRMHVNGNAESIYYVKDDYGGFVGVNKAACSVIDLYFADKKLDIITFRQQPVMSFNPVRGLNPHDYQLRNFSWQAERRPKTKYELMQ